MRLLVLIALAALAPNAVLAAEKAGDPGTNVERHFLVAPMSKDGKLLGYSYITYVLVGSSQSAALEIGAKIAFIQDAYVREVNASPISLASDPTAVDAPLLASRLVADARQIVGAAKVARIVFGDGDKDTGIQFAPLHTTQTPVRADQMDNVTSPPPSQTVPAKPKP